MHEHPLGQNLHTQLPFNQAYLPDELFVKCLRL